MTIYALSTGPGISGIAIIRVSGEDTKKIIRLLTNENLPKARVATLKKINKINKITTKGNNSILINMSTL